MTKKMYRVYWTLGSCDCHKAGPFETRGAAERFLIALPQSINPAKDRLNEASVDAVDVDEDEE